MDVFLQEIGQFAGTCGFHAMDLENKASISFNEDKVLEIASVFKLLPMIAAYRKHEQGALDLNAAVTISRNNHVGGSGVLRELDDDLTTTLRNLVRLMIILSDNVATVQILRRVGVDAVNEVAQSLGLSNTVFHAPRADRKAYATSTALELARLMIEIIEGPVADPQACSEMRAMLSRQFYLDQIPRFISVNRYITDLGQQPSVSVKNKTGFAVGIRSDVAFLEFAEAGPMVIACISNWSQQDPAEWSLLQEPASLLHATLARLAVDSMRPKLISSPFVPFSERRF